MCCVATAEAVYIFAHSTTIDGWAKRIILYNLDKYVFGIYWRMYCVQCADCRPCMSKCEATMCYHIFRSVHCCCCYYYIIQYTTQIEIANIRYVIEYNMYSFTLVLYVYNTCTSIYVECTRIFVRGRLREKQFRSSWCYIHNTHIVYFYFFFWWLRRFSAYHECECDIV